MNLRATVVGAVLAFILHQVPLRACTVFMTAQGGRVLVGNNEDWGDPHSRIRFVPASRGAYARVYVGFRVGGPRAA